MISAARHTGPVDQPCRYRVGADAFAAAVTGGEGLTYRAVDRTTGQTVALKMLTAVPAARFATLATRSAALASVHHPNLMNHLGVFTGTALRADTDADPDDEDFDVICAVSEWVDGFTLDAPGSDRSVAAGLDWVHDVGLALSALHRHRQDGAPHGLVHRDVKPSNVRIRPDGRAVLVDFGAARPVADDMTGAPGTYRWRAPEVLADRDSQTTAVDVWGLGALAHWCLTGDPPALDGAAAARERLLAAARAAGLKRPAGIARHLARLLETDPHDRPADLEAWVAELTALRQGRPRLHHRHRHRPRRPAQMTTVSIAVLGLLAAGLTTVAVNRNRELTAQSQLAAVRERDLADSRRREVAVTLAQASLQRTQTDSRMALQFAQAAFRHDPASTDAREALVTQYARWASAQSMRPAPWPHPLSAVAVARGDSGTVAVAENDATVTVWRGLNGPAPESWSVTRTPGLRGLRLSDDGHRLAVSDERFGIDMWNLDDLQHPVPVRVRQGRPTDALLPREKTMAFSPDGRFLAVSYRYDEFPDGGADTVEVFDTSGRPTAPSLITGRDTIVRRVEPDGNHLWLNEADGAGGRRNVVRAVPTGEVVKDLPPGDITPDGLVVGCRPTPTGAELDIRDGLSGDRRARARVPACADPLPMDGARRFVIATNSSGDDAFALAHLIDLSTGERFRFTLPHTRTAALTDAAGYIVTATPAGPELVTVNSAGVARFGPATRVEEDPPVFGAAAIALSPDLSRLVTDTGKAGGLEVFEVPSQRHLFRGGTGDGDEPPAAASTVFTPDGRLLVIDAAGRLTVQSGSTVLRQMATDTPGASILAADNNVVSVLDGGAVSTWNLGTGQRIRPPLRVPTDTGAARPQVWARPGRPGEAFVGRRDGIDQWNLAEHTVARTFTPERDTPVLRTGPSPHSSLVFLHSSSGRLHVWDPDRGQIRASLSLGDDGSTPMVAGDDLLVTKPAANPSTFEVWDLATSKRIARLDTPGVVRQWAATADHLVAVTGDGIWWIPLRSETWLRVLCGVNDREFTAAERRLLPAGADVRPPCRTS